jgi:cardiolipin synthase
LLVVEGTEGFLSGVCISSKWLGDAKRGIPPWRDTGVWVRGPAVAEIETAFVQNWSSMGASLAQLHSAAKLAPHDGSVAMRVIATHPPNASVYRLDQLVASLARRSLWLCDAYFIGVAPYVQALVAAARDGVDVRMLVPGSSDIPIVGRLSRSGYRPLLQAGIRVFEWNGSMLHAKTAVADGVWARVGSSNLNVASWLGNREIDVAIEDAGFAAQMEAQYERDLQNATEIVLAPRRRRGKPILSVDPRPATIRRAGGGSGRAAAGALRVANSVGAALANHRVLGDMSNVSLISGVLVLTILAVVCFLWPAWIGWPIGILAAWSAFNLGLRAWRLWRQRRRMSADT